MIHYVYLLTFPDGMMYVGCRSTNLVKAEYDVCYLGSGRRLPKDRHDYRHLIKKDILGTFASRKEAINYEINYIVSNDCANRSNYYNCKKSTYDRFGLPNANPMNGILRAKALATFKNRNYRGNNRTPAQKAHIKYLADIQRGVKNPAKGHSGTTNSAFVAWYYIDPNGNYVEVHNETKQDYAHKLGFTPRQLSHRFHHTNEHKESNRHPFKGWTFGNLPKP